MSYKTRNQGRRREKSRADDSRPYSRCRPSRIEQLLPQGGTAIALLFVGFLLHGCGLANSGVGGEAPASGQGQAGNPAAGGESGAGLAGAGGGAGDGQAGSPSPGEEGGAPSAGTGGEAGQAYSGTAGEPAAKGSCCEAHEQPGCDDPAIEACVCDTQKGDPTCCNEAWDLFCMTLVDLLSCGTCKTKGPCCSDNGTEGCDDPSIEACVCAELPDCCDLKWDFVCAELVSILDCGSC